jgi:uncharacterized OB-fold protein
MSEARAVRDGLFALDADGGGRLLGGYCAACARYHFPAGADCPYCSARGCERRALSQRGRLCLFTTVVNRPPGYAGDVPFGFGVVELPEGLRVIARLTETDADRLAFDMPVRVTFVPLHVDDEGRPVVTYAFAPDAVGQG